jgi:hypothetical protein
MPHQLTLASAGFGIGVAISQQRRLALLRDHLTDQDLPLTVRAAVCLLLVFGSRSAAARRGRTRTRPSASRSTRGRAKPHPAKTPEQNGQTSPPDRSLCSTRSASASTVSTSCLRAAHTALPGGSAKRKSGRAVSHPDPLTLAPHGTKSKPQPHPQRRSAATTLTAHTSSHRTSFNSRGGSSGEGIYAPVSGTGMKTATASTCTTAASQPNCDVPWRFRTTIPKSDR